MFLSGIAYALIRYTQTGQQEQREMIKGDDELPLLLTVNEDEQFSLLRNISG
jgi:hypothetical protein